MAAGSLVLTALLAPVVALADTPPNVLVVAQSIDDAVSFDPAEGFELTTVQAFNNLYQRLVQPNREDGTKIEPALASSWEIGADGRSITFALKPGATFASGNPVRPEDVIFSFARAVKLNKAPAFILNELGWTANSVDAGIAKVDDAHVKVSWTADVGPAFVLAILTAPIASVVDEATVAPNAANDDFGNGWLKTRSAGSGAFAIQAYTPHEALVLAANAKAPGGAPKLQTVIVRNVPDAAARRLLIEQGDADVARGLGADQITALKQKQGVQVLAIPSARTDYLLINTKVNASLGNPAFWEAARYLVDYQGIADNLLQGQSEVHQAFLPEGFPGALKDTPFKLDVAKAKKILTDAGIAEGLTVRFPVFNEAPFLQIAQSLQSTFGQAGIKLDIQPGVPSDIYAKGRSGDYEFTLRYWIPDYFDPHSNASAFAINRDNSANTVAKQAGWVIPDLSDETAAAVKEQDPAKRAALYEALQRKLQQSSPFVFMLQGKDQVVLRDGVKGYVQGLNADQVYYDMVSK
ncbi:ABC transporter substrate-binding protein [Aureimonas leprariae]|uniref:ABC transporter substrate-binding protein n=1 Tax=Plantimonas leprariae TaxID=2615207 RepID=A0A7V7PKM8_9HYPH|nr:ABC transporter substrate-binding protein [Aureimonas leprariae]KAB0676456.1 ABC transporter substrate-binding protein [Aureimonas leprariae]